MILDKFSCKMADKVIVVGRDMIETLEERFTPEGGQASRNTPKNTFINNWIDENEIYPLSNDNEQVYEFKKKYGLLNKFVVMYSGNLGLYYDLENLIKITGQFKYENEIVFAFVGEGTVLDKLLKYKEDQGLENVVFIPYQKKSDLIYSLNAGDVHWVVNAKGIKGVSVPSKLYGVMAAGKPVLGVLDEGSEARLIIEESNCGYVADPGNYKEVELNINRLFRERETSDFYGMGLNGREYLVKNLTKKVSISKYINEIKSC